MNRILFIFLSAAIAGVTLGMSSSILSVYTVPKTVAVLLAAGIITPPLFLVSDRRVPSVLFVQFLPLVAATVFSMNPSISFWGGDWRRMGLLTVASMVMIACAVPLAIDGKRDRWIRLLRVIAAVGCMAAVYGILQWLGLDPLIPASVRDRVTAEFAGAYRTGGPIGQPTYFANYLMYPLFAAVALLFLESSRRWRVCAGITVCASLASIALTSSRGGILGLAAAVAALLAIRMRKAIVWILAGAFASATLTLAYLAGTSRGGGRLVLWRDVVQRLLPEVWMAGTGLGMFRPWFARVRSDAYSAFNPDTHWESAHNLLLDRWAEQGIVGLLVFIFLLCIFFRNMWLSYRAAERTDVQWAILSLNSALTGALVSNMFNAEIIPTAFYFYIWLGLSFAIRDSCVTAEKPARFRGPRFAFGVALAAAVFLFWHAHRNWDAERKFSQAVEALHRGDVRTFLINGRAASMIFPVESTYGVEVCQNIVAFISESETRIDDVAKERLASLGIDHCNRAAASSDKSAIALYGLSALGLRTKDARVEEWLSTLLKIDPYWYRPHWLYAELLLERGQIGAAQRHALNARRLAPYRPELDDLETRLRYAATP